MRYLFDLQRFASRSMFQKGQRPRHKVLQMSELGCARGRGKQRAWETTCVGNNVHGIRRAWDAGGVGHKSKKHRRDGDAFS